MSNTPTTKELIESVEVEQLVFTDRAALVRALRRLERCERVVEAARSSPCRHTSDRTADNCPVCSALTALSQTGGQK